MAELKIPQKTLQDNFNLQDFKDDFNALNSEISRLEEITNTWEAFKNNGGAINGDIAIEKHLANLRIGDSFNIKTHDQNTELSSDWNKSIVLRVRSNATDSASHVRLNNVNFAGNGNMSLGEQSTPWTDIYLKGVSKSQNGYTKLPNGLIMQWGYVTISKNTGHGGVEGFEVPIVFPISFPTMPVSISCVPGTNHYDVHKIVRHLFRYDTLNNNGVSSYVYVESGGSWHVKMFYIAIGY